MPSRLTLEGAEGWNGCKGGPGEVCGLLVSHGLAAASACKACEVLLRSVVSARSDSSGTGPHQTRNSEL